MCSITFASACGGGGEVDAPVRELSSTAARDNTAPRIEHVRLEPATPVPGAPVRVVAEVHDREGDPVKMTYEWSLRGKPAGSGTSKLALQDAARGDRLEVVVIASDGRDESEPRRVETAVGNRPPEITRLQIRPSLAITAGEEIRIEPEGLDPDDDRFEYRYTWLLDGEPLEHEDSVLDTSQLHSGDVVTVEVRGDDRSDLGEPLVSPPIRVVNEAPRVVSQPGTTASGDGFRYAVVAEDPDGDKPLRFSLEEAPKGMEIGPQSGEVQWRPRYHQSGRYRVRVIVDDLRGGSVAHVFEVDVGDASPASVGG